MCWISKTEPVRKVADKDVRVYKILLEGIGGSLWSPYQKMEYKFNVVHEEEIGEVKAKRGVVLGMGDITHPSYHYEIWEGLHSYSADKMYFSVDCYSVHVRTYETPIGLDTWLPSSNAVIALGIIPKGAEYYEDERGEIVSNKLEIKKVYGSVGLLCREVTHYYDVQVPKEWWS